MAVINPFSGKRKSIQIFHKIKPIFNSNEIELSVFETKFQGHAKELIEETNLNTYQGIVLLGGDGTFHEVVNGMLNRRDKKKIPIGNKKLCWYKEFNNQSEGICPISFCNNNINNVTNNGFHAGHIISEYNK